MITIGWMILRRPLRRDDDVTCHIIVAAMYIFDDVDDSSVIADELAKLHDDYVANKKLIDEHARIDAVNDRYIAARLALVSDNNLSDESESGDEVVGIEMY